MVGGAVLGFERVECNVVLFEDGVRGAVRRCGIARLRRGECQSQEGAGSVVMAPGAPRECERFDEVHLCLVAVALRMDDQTEREQFVGLRRRARVIDIDIECLFELLPRGGEVAVGDIRPRHDAERVCDSFRVTETDMYLECFLDRGVGLRGASDLYECDRAGRQSSGDEAVVAEAAGESERFAEGFDGEVGGIDDGSRSGEGARQKRAIIKRSRKQDRVVAEPARHSVSAERE